jgi:hypothetical protein
MTVILRCPSDARASKDAEGYALRPSRLGAFRAEHLRMTIQKIPFRFSAD